MKQKLLFGSVIILIAVLSGIIGWSIGNHDNAGYQLTIAALQDKCEALEYIIETGNWTPYAWSWSGKPLYPVKPSYK